MRYQAALRSEALEGLHVAAQTVNFSLKAAENGRALGGDSWRTGQYRKGPYCGLGCGGAVEAAV